VGVRFVNILFLYFTTEKFITTKKINYNKIGGLKHDNETQDNKERRERTYLDEQLN